jgi:hypothetical protein
MKLVADLDDRKSQIAIEAGYRYRESEPLGHVFWIHASTAQRFNQGYRDIGRRFLPSLDDKDNDSQGLQAVRDWHTESGPWFLILDNADDLEIFFSEIEQIKPLINYLPHSPNGSILITSRDRRLGERLAGRDNCVTILPPDQDEAEALLRSKTAPELWDSSVAGTLVEALERLPLGNHSSGSIYK